MDDRKKILDNRNIIRKAYLLAKNKNNLLLFKLKRALRYKSTSFNLIEGDENTSLNRSDLQYLINLLENGRR